MDGNDRITFNYQHHFNSYHLCSQHLYRSNTKFMITTIPNSNLITDLILTLSTFYEKNKQQNSENDQQQKLHSIKSFSEKSKINETNQNTFKIDKKCIQNNRFLSCRYIKSIFSNNNYNKTFVNSDYINCNNSYCNDFVDIYNKNVHHNTVNIMKINNNCKNMLKNDRVMLEKFRISNKNQKFSSTNSCRNSNSSKNCKSWSSSYKHYKKVSNLDNRINNCNNNIYNKKITSKCWSNDFNNFKSYWRKILSCLAVIIMTVNNLIVFRMTTFSHTLSTLISSVLSSETQSSIKRHKSTSASATTTTTTTTILNVYNTNSSSNPLTSIFSSIIFLILFLTIITTTTTPCVVAGSTISPPKIVNAEVPDSNTLDYSASHQQQQQQQQQTQQQHQPYNHHQNQHHQHHHHQQQQHHQVSKINEAYSSNGNKMWDNSNLNENLNDIVNDSNDSGDGDVINNEDDDDDGGDDDDTGDGSHTNVKSLRDKDNKNNDNIKKEIKNYHYHRRREVNSDINSTLTVTITTTDSSTSMANINIGVTNSFLKDGVSYSLTSNFTSGTNSSTPIKITTTQLPPCEPKILERIPPDPLFDVEDICIDAAKEFAEFLSTKSSLSILENSQQSSSLSSAISSSLSSSSSSTNGSGVNTQIGLIDDIRKKANSIANEALQMDENLLAFAIASPILHIAVVKFRDNVTIPAQDVHNKAFLGVYWRELGLAWNNSDGTHEWGAPFRDCNALPGRWLWPYRISVIDSGYKIVATAFIAADIDLCNDNLEDIFGRKHGCDRDTTFCLMTGDPKPSIINRDGYTCICRDSYYLPNSSTQGFRSELVENLSPDMENNYTCIPCPGGCFTCDQNGVCLMGSHDNPVSMEMLFKASVGSILGACMLCCLVLAVIVFKRRKSKAIATGMWTVLETIVLGILLLYASVALHFLPASTTRCLLEPWFRELGFMTCYGAIILKLYRHLVEFRTRKAHRWVLRDVDLLKYLGTMVFAVICYMSAFTASSIDLIENAELFGLQEVQTNTCVSLKWEYVTQISEILIICFGLNLAFASRNANTQFRERQFLVAALIIEFIVSSCFYILRVIYLPELSPGAIFLALFIRSQLTNTVTLGLVFLPKLWYQHKQVCSLAHDLSFRLPVDAFKGSHDTGHHLGGGYAGLCLGDPDIGELTISEMSPEDIRAELKRLYTQLEILKNKTLRQDNPHISKRRGGRKAGHRRFSLQKKGSKDKALSSKHRNKHHDIEITEAEPSRTPEDSVCSAEGPTDTYAEISGISHSMLSHSVLSHSK